MRFLRLAALFGSVILLVATVASLVNRRAELFRERDARVEAAATAAGVGVDEAVGRARAVAAAATGATPLDAVVRALGDAEACIVEAERCSGDDLTTDAAFGPAVERSTAAGGAPVAVVGGDGVLVVARGDSTIVLRIGFDALVGAGARRAIGQLGADVAVSPTPETAPMGAEPTTVDGRRIAGLAVTDPFDDGAVAVQASVSDGVGWGATAPGVYATLLALGAVLLAGAGWTFLVERRQLEQRATTDELTRLVNRREFERQSEDAIEMAGRIGAGLCIMLIDLNGFKQINDTLGHQVGDLVLRTCADRLRDAVRDTDLVGRWGGDEFVVLLPGLEDAGAVRDSAERIFHSLSAAPAARDVIITGSIGAALFPRHGTVLEDLMHAADEAMYEAKSSGVIHRLATAIPTTTQLAPPTYLGPERRRTAASTDEPAHH